MRAALLLLVVTGCNWDFNRMNDQARCEPGDSRPWLPDHRCDQRAPAGTVTWRAKAMPPEPAPTRTSIARGRDRFNRFCATCHGVLADGNSVISRDMMLRHPPSLHSAEIVGYPNQRIFEVITSGYGLMPSYAYQVAPEDRWAIIHYLRVLERSQAFPLAELPPARREEARRWLP